jgi:steroid delta-isomerase-like uncharacterized protein
MSSVEDNVELVRRYCEQVLGKGQVGRLEEFLAPDFEDTNPGADAAMVERPRGIEGIREWWQTVFRAFPDTRLEIHVLFGEDDKVIEHATVRGTHTGPWMAFPPTGKELVWEMTEMYRIEDGKIVQRWGAYDQLSLMGQMGVVRGPMGDGPPGAPPGAGATS